MRGTTREWISRHREPIGVALISVGAFLATVVIALYVSPSSRDFAIKAVVAGMAVLFAVVVAWAQTPLTRLKPVTAGGPALTIGEHLKRTRAYYVRITTPIVTAWKGWVFLFEAGIPKMQQQALAIGGALVLSLNGWLFM
jgi:hypothetical protein